MEAIQAILKDTRNPLITYIEWRNDHDKIITINTINYSEAVFKLRN